MGYIEFAFQEPSGLTEISFFVSGNPEPLVASGSLGAVEVSPGVYRITEGWASLTFPYDAVFDGDSATSVTITASDAGYDSDGDYYLESPVGRYFVGMFVVSSGSAIIPIQPPSLAAVLVATLETIAEGEYEFKDPSGSLIDPIEIRQYSDDIVTRLSKGRYSFVSAWGTGQVSVQLEFLLSDIYAGEELDEYELRIESSVDMSGDLYWTILAEDSPWGDTYYEDLIGSSFTLKVGSPNPPEPVGDLSLSFEGGFQPLGGSVAWLARAGAGFVSYCLSDTTGEQYLVHGTPGGEWNTVEGSGEWQIHNYHSRDGVLLISYYHYGTDPAYRIARTTDGVTYAVVQSASIIQDLLSGGRTAFFALHWPSNSVLTSVDGVTWSTFFEYGDDYEILDVVEGDGVFLLPASERGWPFDRALFRRVGNGAVELTTPPFPLGEVNFSWNEHLGCFLATHWWALQPVFMSHDGLAWSELPNQEKLVIWDDDMGQDSDNRAFLDGSVEVGEYLFMPRPGDGGALNPPMLVWDYENDPVPVYGAMLGGTDHYQPHKAHRIAPSEYFVAYSEPSDFQDGEWEDWIRAQEPKIGVMRFGGPPPEPEPAPAFWTSFRSTIEIR